ncbi:MAG: alpha/beta hydrolase domain-containing protein [Vicinamibacterales bacterium]
MVSLLGSRIPFPKTAGDAAASHDPRKPIAERYASKDAYLAEARRVADELVMNRYLLANDLSQVMGRMEQQWTQATGH